MLDYMRKRQSSVLIKIIFGVLLLVMVAFGINYSSVNSSSTETVAEVNEHPIYRQQLQRTVSRMVQSYRNIYKEAFTSEMVKALKFKDQALDDLIRMSLLRQEADRLGLEVTNDEVRDAIAAIPSFQDNGRFNRDFYLQVLRSNSMNPSDFEDMQREDLLVRKLQDLLISGVYVSDAEVKQQFDYDNEQVALRFARVKAAELENGIEINDEQLQKFYDENKDLFEEPEKVRAEIISYGPAAFADKVVVEDAEVEAFFKGNSKDFEGKTLDDVRGEIQITMRENKAVTAAREAAAADLEKAKNGEALPALAQASGGKHQSVGPLALSDSVPGAGRVPLLMRALFATEVGQLGGVVETERDAYVLQVVEKIPARVPELSQIRDKVRAAARAEAASKKARDRAAEILKKVQESKDLTAASEGLAVQDTDPFRRLDGLIPNLGPQPDLRVDAFKLTKESPVAPQVYDVEGDAVVAVLKERLPADAAAFDSQKDSIRSQIDDRRKRLVVDAYIKELRERSLIRINPDALDRVYVS